MDHTEFEARLHQAALLGTANPSNCDLALFVDADLINAMMAVTGVYSVNEITVMWHKCLRYGPNLAAITLTPCPWVPAITRVISEVIQVMPDHMDTRNPRIHAEFVTALFHLQQKHDFQI